MNISWDYLWLFIFPSIYLWANFWDSHFEVYHLACCFFFIEITELQKPFTNRLYGVDLDVGVHAHSNKSLSSFFPNITK